MKQVIQKRSFNENKHFSNKIIQVFGHFSQVLRGVGRRPSSSSGNSGLLRPLWRVGLALQVLPSTQDFLALYEVLIGVTEREIDILHLSAHEAEV